MKINIETEVNPLDIIEEIGPLDKFVLLRKILLSMSQTDFDQLSDYFVDDWQKKEVILFSNTMYNMKKIEGIR